MDYFKYLPLETIVDIISRLPIESILWSKLVSTTWRNHVRHSSFSHMQLHHGKSGFIALAFDLDNEKESFWYFEYNHEATTPVQRIRKMNLTSPVRDSFIVGSCNGLICFARRSCVWVCNPITREQVMLPEIEIILRDSKFSRSVYWRIGFGYVSSTNEYKVVGMYEAEANIVQVYMYTLGSGKGWRRLGNFNLECCPKWIPGNFANGALYWLDTRSKMIITFDLAEEKFFKNIPPPPVSQDIDWRDTNIGVLDGFLFFEAHVFVEGSGYYDTWILRNNGVNREMKDQGGHQSLVWSKVFRIDDGSILLGVTESDGVFAYSYKSLITYDTKTLTLKGLVEFKHPLRRVSPHKNTFVSLKELGEEDTKTLESVEPEETRSRGYTSEHPQEDVNPEYIYL